MEIQIEHSGEGQAIIRLKGELVIAHCAPVRSRVVKALEEGDRAITLNLSEVSFIDSAGLGLLIGLRQTTRQRGGEFQLDGVHKKIQPLFQMTRLNKIFGLPD